MSLQQTIKDSIKDAMRAKDSVRLTVLRGLSAAFVNELVAKGQTPQSEISDEDAMVVIKRASKQRKDALEQYTKGGRKDLADIEKAELVIIEEFLPTLMSQDEIRPIVEAKIAELGVADKSGTGKLIGALMRDLNGKADGGDVKIVVDELLG